jgi:hypothetical protein
VIENNVTAGEDQNNHRAEGPAIGRETAARTEENNTGVVGALQEKVEQLVMESDAAKNNIDQIEAKDGQILQSPITEQVVTNMANKSIQAQQQCQQIMEMYDTLQQAISKARRK